MNESSSSILETIGLTKRFGGTVALDHVDFDLRRGEVHAICGENGAGKSTLIKVLSGVHPPGSFEGEVRIDGQPAQMRSIRDAEAMGIAVIYQELALVPQLTAAQNIFLGSEPTRLGLIDARRINREAQKLLDRFGIDLDATTPVEHLGVGAQQLVEIGKALSKHSRILILDEPTAALTEQEVGVLLNILRELRREGISCIYITHKLDEVFAVADRVTVLRDGRSVSTKPIGQTDRHTVINEMVGREIADFFPRRATPTGDVLLSVEQLNVTGPRRLGGITFDVRAGEVLGIGGLMGAGRSELLMNLFGAYGKRTGGRVTLLGEPFDRPTPRRALRRGMVLVTEDRKRYGLHAEQSVSFNLTLSCLTELTVGWLISAGKVARAGERQFADVGVRGATLESLAASLSGGNQQKVVLGKALMTRPRVVLLDEPTRGIDVGAKVEIYERINDLTAQGLAVVMVSSELPELIGMSDRILMLSEGTTGGMFERSEATQERLMAAAMSA